MSFEKKHHSEETLTTIESKTKQLGYKDEIKDFIGENPGAIKKATELIDRIINSDPKVGQLEEDGLEVTFIPSRFDEYPFETIEEGNPNFRVSLKGRDFFVKRLDKTMFQPHDQGGFGELTDSAEAKKRLQNIPGVRIVEFLLGYSTEKYNYFVSRFESGNVVPLVDYMKGLSERRDPESQAELDDITNKEELIKRDFNDYLDIDGLEEGLIKAFYDPRKKEIVMFDFNKKRSSR